MGSASEPPVRINGRRPPPQATGRMGSLSYRSSFFRDGFEPHWPRPASSLESRVVMTPARTAEATAAEPMTFSKRTATYASATIQVAA